MLALTSCNLCWWPFSTITSAAACVVLLLLARCDGMVHGEVVTACMLWLWLVTDKGTGDTKCACN